MIFARATIADAEILTELRLAYLDEDLGPLDAARAGAFRAALPDYFRRHLDRDLFGYIARESGQTVACALLLFTEKPPSPAFPSGRTGTVLNVYTSPAFRRRGVARKLMETLLSDALRLGLSTVELKATEAGQALYRSLGFRGAEARYQAMTWRNPEQSDRSPD